ncbi:hypothetical protein ACFLIM_30005 [Nonomuraea sp. M3C6]|uniref:MarR family transcriptional regulator n=1 Tax=Nonomuraea marmarensis TaxID=3351344 RepID=A0ABW7AK67_9ACTN
MILRGEIPDFHSPHVKPPRPGHVKLTWYEPTRRAQRIRVISHTCECRQTTYELCAAAGQGFVRRTDRKEGTVRETTWTLTAAARRTFEQIMRGEAR